MVAKFFAEAVFICVPTFELLKLLAIHALAGCYTHPFPKQIQQVVQLAGYVSEHSAYHHGEASLNGTITAMAQNYTGSNNLNLLTPGGQFGTRLMGGKVHRYILGACARSMGYIAW